MKDNIIYSAREAGEKAEDNHMDAIYLEISKLYGQMTVLAHALKDEHPTPELCAGMNVLAEHVKEGLRALTERLSDAGQKTNATHPGL